MASPVNLRLNRGKGGPAVAKTEKVIVKGKPKRHFKPQYVLGEEKVARKIKIRTRKDIPRNAHKATRVKIKESPKAG